MGLALDKNTRGKESSDPRTVKVAKFFDEPAHYFHRDFKITVRAAIVRELVQKSEGLSIFDFGCGDGSLSLQFQHEASHITLVDLSDTMLQRAKKNILPHCADKVTLIKGDFARLTEASPADLVLCIGVLAHVERVSTAIRQVAALTKSGGRCLLQITDYDRLLGRLQYLTSRARKRKGYTLQGTRFRDVREIAFAEGLRFVQRRNHGLILPGMGALPNSWLLNFDRFVLGSSTLSRLAPSAVLLFEK